MTHKHHVHEHNHEHICEQTLGEGGHSEFDKVLALMGYMLEHNRQHTAELEAMAEKLTDPSQKESAALLRESASFYSKGNEKLADSLKKIKEA